MSKVLSLEDLTAAIRSEACKVYDRSDFGGCQEGFHIELEGGDSLNVSKTGRVVIEYRLERVDVKRLSVLALRQSADYLDTERANIGRKLKLEETELVKLLKERGEL